MSIPKPAVAIVGISAELPGGSTLESNLNHETFFKFLLEKKEAYDEVPPERFNIEAWHGSNLGQVLPRKGCFLKNVSEFDHAEFGIALKDVHAMALSTRKLLEHSFLALLDAGIDSRGQDVGVYTAGTAFDILSLGEVDVFDARGLLSGIPSMIANKISYHLDLTGPSIPIDTACSSSLTALHLATQALRAGECKSALVGGSQLNHRFIDFVQYSQSSVLAPDGKCKPFDAASDGFSRGEGVVVMVLKLLDDAVRDGDHIYASILGTAINNTGSAAPLYAPVANAQRKAMESAFRQTNCLPSEVDFVELHATGTAAGDPVEANAMGEAFRGDRELLVGSVKGNIGHTEIAAFLASLSKVCSIFETGLIPPTANLLTLNPQIRWKEHNMRAPTEVAPLGKLSGRSLIAIASSGIGGSNGHVVVEAPPLQEHSSLGLQTKPVLLVAAGLSPQTASAVAAALASSNPAERSILSTIYGRRSRQLTWRTFATWTPGQASIDFPPPVLSPKTKAPIAFVFSGQGPQHFNMGRQLFKSSEVFRASILRMDKVFRSITGQSLIEDFGLFDDVRPKVTLSDIWPIAVTQPALIILEMALYDLLVAHGVFPDLVVAHSAGETAMLYASGAIPQEMAVEIATARGLAMCSVEAFGGAMAAVGCTAEEAAQIIQHVAVQSDPLEVGCYNGPADVTLSGSEAAIDRAVDYAQNQGFFVRKIRTYVAGHSSLMDRCRDDYQARMREIYSRYPGEHLPSKPTYSSQTGSKWTAEFTADYMWTNARNPVYFAKVISALWQENPDVIFVEISPHPVLTSYITSSIGVKSDIVLAPLRRSKILEPFAEVVSFLRVLGQLTSLGSNRVDFRALNGPTALKSVSLPPYPFNRKPIPYCSPSTQAAITRGRNGPLNYPGMALNVLTHPDLAQHVIKGEAILPATAYLEMAFEFGASHLWNVEFVAMLPLLKDRVLRVEVTADKHRWEVRSWSAEQPQISSRLHACGYMSRENPPDATTPLDVKAIQARCVSLPVKHFYESIKYFAQYGPAFRQIRHIWAGDNEALVEINTDFFSSDNNYIVNPAILDSCLHVLVHPTFTGDANQNTYFLPSKIQDVILHRDKKIPGTLYSHSTFRNWHPDYLVFDIIVVDSMGNNICSMLGARITKHGGQPDENPRHYAVEYHPMSSTKFLSARQPAAQYPDYGFLKHIGTGRDIIIEPATLSEIQYPAEATVAQVCDILDHLVAQRKTVISILEIGNVSGSLSRLLSTLSEEYPNISLSCVTSSVVAPAPEICSGLPSVAFDPDKDLATQGLSRWAYDVIVGTHVLGFVENLTVSLRNLHDLLVPGGFLVVCEATSEDWIDAVFPPNGGWKGGQSKEHHRFDGATWTKHLAVNGFTPLISPSNNPQPQLFVIISTQRDALDVPTSPGLITTKAPHVVSFPSSRHILDLQSLLSHLEESAEPQTLWVEATHDTLSGAVARGFTRSLRREGLSTDIRLVLFDAIWSLGHRNAIIRYLAQFPELEREIIVDSEAKIYVPRIVLQRSALAPPPARGQFPNCWKYHPPKKLLLKSSPGILADREVVVQVLSASKLGPLTGIVGVVHTTHSKSWAVGTRIVGVSASDLSNMQIFFEGEIAEVPADADFHRISTLAVPLLILALALGSHLLSPSRLIGKRVQIIEDHALAQYFQHLWQTLNLETSSLHIGTSSASDIVITGRLDSAALQVLQSRLQPDASVFIWDDPLSGLYPRLLKERWLAGDVLQKYLPALCLKSLPFEVTGKEPHEHISPAYSISSSLEFDPNKVYLLLGGIGSFGIHVAIWMYARGARHIVLTSRSGKKSISNKQALERAYSYLAARPQLDLRLQVCDSTSADQMRALLNSIHLPLAGCILLSAVLVDGLFMSCDPARDSAYEAPISSKIDAFQVIEKAIAIEKLDFFISTTSVMSFGSGGQTNYSAANTGLEWLTKRYPNAFSLVAPGITDSAFALNQLSSTDPASLRWLKYAMSCQELCACIENGLQRLTTAGSFETHIPDLDWDAVAEHLGPSPLYQHLRSPFLSTTLVSDDRSTVQKIVMTELRLDDSELDPAVPLTSYGLDSLSASRLASALKHLFPITQLQLLADVTVQDLQGRLTETLEDVVSLTEAHDAGEKPFDWKVENQHGDNLIKLVIGHPEDTPLILVHGGSGSALHFQPLQQMFTSALWAFQYTPDTPFSSFDELVVFYLTQIKAVRPSGPYRLGAYSASSLIGLELVRRLEASGDTVVQLAFIDHFPLLFASPLLLPGTQSLSADKNDAALRLIYTLLRHENWTKRDPRNEEGKQRRIMIEKTNSVMFPHLMALAGHTATEEERQSTKLKGALMAAIDGVNAPVTVYLAGRGILGILRDICPSGEWDDFGVSSCRKPINAVVFEDEGHESLLHSKVFSNSLECSWKEVL